MANPRQKLKNRSRISKARPKPKSKRRILQNPIIAENWDKTQTLTQNYQRLGLTSKLNKITGGVDRKVVDLEREKKELAETGASVKDDSLSIGGHKRRPEQQLEVREAKVERDPKTGRILQILDDGGVKRRANPLNDPLNDLDSSDSDDEGRYEMFDQHGHGATGGLNASDGKTQTVRALQFEADRPIAKHKRRQTDGEKAFIEELVRKYGDDVEKMSRDMKINYMQRSAGDLKRRIKRWREEGGSLG